MEMKLILYNILMESVNMFVGGGIPQFDLFHAVATIKYTPQAMQSTPG